MKKIKNIIVVCDFAYIEGGAGRVAHESAMALAKVYNVTLFAAVGPVSETLKDSDVNVICLDQSDILNNKNRFGAVVQGIWNGTSKKRFAEVLDGFSPDDTVVHVHTWTKAVSSSIFKLTEKKGFKVILTIHDYFLSCPNGGFFDYKGQRICEIQPMTAKCVCKDCDSRSYFHKVFRLLRQAVQNNSIRKRKNIQYIYISDFSKQQLMKRNLDLGNCIYVKNPINFENDITVDCRSNKTYLFAGRVTEDKGIRIFCEAVTRANVPATVLGSGVLKEELEKKYPNIEFVGWVNKSDMTKYLQKTRCFVFPSLWYEGSPLTPLEMMACGIPVIASDLNASKGDITDGKNGLLYDGYSTDALVECIEKTKDDGCITHMCEYIQTHFDENEYSMESHIKNLTMMYDSVLNG